MNKQPKISIITPSFNCAPYIRTCIESVLAQNYPNFEHIIVDGASQDGTVEILKQYPHLRWISEPDNGEAEALNKALRMIEGDIVGWLNTDDWYAEGVFHRIAAEMKPHRGRHIVYGNTVMVDKNGRFLWEKKSLPGITRVHLVRWWLASVLPHQPSMFFSRTLVNDIGAFNKDLYYSIDYEYWLRCSLKYQFDYIDQTFACARWRENSKSIDTEAVQIAGHWKVSLPFHEHLTSFERIDFWKDFYLYMWQHESAMPPRNLWALTGLSLALLEMGYVEDTIFHLRTFYDDKSTAPANNQYVLIGLVLALVETGKHEAALFHVDRLLEHSLAVHADSETRSLLEQVRQQVCQHLGQSPAFVARAQHVEPSAAVLADSGTPVVPLLWHAPIYDPSGYADEARNFILHLQVEGIEIAAREIGRHSSTFRNQLGPQARHQLDEALRQEVVPDFISIVHFPAYAFQRLPQAAYNIGRVMFETDGLPAEWVAKCNQMDEIWVPTDFNLQTFRKAGVTAKLFKVPGGIDTDRFQPGYDPLPIPDTRDVVFLSIFEWIYRKGWDVLLRAWAKAFRPTDNVSLVLRTYPINATDIPDSKQEIERRIDHFLRKELELRRDEVAPIIVLGEQVPEKDMPRLFAAANAYVAPSRGEGWGRPQMAAMACGRPVIATRWSGNLEFMNDENAYLIDIEGLVEIDERAEIPFYRGQRWAQPSVEHLTELMRHVYDHPDAARAKGRRARRDMVENWTWDHAARLALQRLEAVSDQLSVISDQSSAHQPPSHPATQPSANLQSPISNLQSPTIRWEGSQFVTHSLALVNRELCIRLAQDPDIDLSIIPYEPHQFGPDADPRFKHIVSHLNRPLHRPADVHVRHQWPPNLTPPPEGHWVIMQPWEFGSIPKRWIETMREQVDDVWVYTSYVRDCYIRSGVPADRVHVVPLGVDTAKFHPDTPPLDLSRFNTQYPISNTQYKFLFVGGTISRKGIDILLDAYVTAFTAADDVCLVIKDMGGQSFYKGQTAQDMIARCRHTPDAPEIEYIDRTLSEEDLAGLYTACDCLVHPYRGEGFGLPIAEAMSSGRPVIVTGHGAALDFCTSETAYLIPAREVRLPQKRIGDLETVDYPWWADPDCEALQQLMRHVVANPAEARAKGQAARACIQANFTWDRAAEAVRQRIAALCQQPIRRFASVDAGAGHLTAAEQALAELFAAGQAALDRDDLETAAGEFARLTEQAPDLAAGHTALGSTLMALGRIEEAIPPLRRATELVPHEPALHNQLGIALYQVGELEAAEEAFQAAIRVSPADVDTLLNLIEIYRAQDRYIEATECIKQAMQVAPNDVGVLTAFGTLGLELGDTEAARSALQHLQVLAPDQPVAQALEQALGDTGQEELSQRET